MTSNRVKQAARKLMAERPGLRYTDALRLVTGEQAPQPLVSGSSPWFGALGIDDVGTFDPLKGWSQSQRAHEIGFVPVGFELDRDRSPVGTAYLSGGQNTIVAGSSGAGKSHLCDNALLSVAATYSPRRVQFVLASTWHSAFHNCHLLPHTIAIFERDPSPGFDKDAVVAPDKLDALPEMLVQEYRRRAEFLTAAGSPSIAAYRKSSAANASPPPPDLIVLVEEFGALEDFAEVYEPALRMVCEDGPRVGVNLWVVEGSVVNEVTGKTAVSDGPWAPLIGSFSQRICFRTSDANDVPFLLGNNDTHEQTPGWDADVSLSGEAGYRRIICFDNHGGAVGNGLRGKSWPLRQLTKRSLATTLRFAIS
ncbi:hypothetical protein B5P44_00660 [Mycobacterium sp. CBMA 213]|uniref:ESX secretion system protein EccC n=1 Tax=Mycolicibacterium sp. CBMA 213 TaxID=1968788 RepID=A0A343VRB6_9MYCO|nr:MULTISPECIES: FtsK/SpoIIIE domain-containing protein [unclassified Mycolicibacterium]AVN58440.1 ESX secretion system protein EccC [Mycolicibacterium sp. CBMA 213]MUL61097.1 hypothetical protein [Mycolicibacterium sp. CBMA 335]MUM03334.1 hypothetical protein [Mycolicibacterium sp. CBMA 213]